MKKITGSKIKQTPGMKKTGSKIKQTPGMKIIQVGRWCVFAASGMYTEGTS